MGAGIRETDRKVHVVPYLSIGVEGPAVFVSLREDRRECVIHVRKILIGIYNHWRAGEHRVEGFLCIICRTCSRKLCKCKSTSNETRLTSIRNGELLSIGTFDDDLTAIKRKVVIVHTMW